MKNPMNREMMSVLYRLIEKYEVPPGPEHYIEWYESLLDEANAFYYKFPCPFSRRFAVAFIEAAEDNYEAIHGKWKDPEDTDA